MKKIYFTVQLALISVSVFGQTLLDETGDAFLRNSANTTTWSGTTNLTLRATAAQTSGFKLSYEADSNPRVGRLTLNDNYGGIYGDFAISLRNSSGTFEKFRLKNQGVEFFSHSTQNSLYIGRDINQNFKFHVTDNHGYLDYNQDEDENGSHVFYIRNLSGGTAHTNDIRFQVTGQDRLTIDSRGYIGIGTNEPSNMFEVYRNTGNETVAQFRTDDGTINIAAAGATTENPTYGNYISSRNAGNTAYEDFGLKTAPGIPQLLVKTNGSVGIGTNNTGTHKLSVNGSIRSKEVKVEANWSDFVFYDNYNLRTLEEVEQHISEKGHLPEIPSEAEVTENGINLGEMDSKLLQKIEELTLYLIEQNKQNQAQQSEIEELRKEIKLLKNN